MHLRGANTVSVWNQEHDGLRGELRCREVQVAEVNAQHEAMKAEVGTLRASLASAEKGQASVAVQKQVSELQGEL